MLVKKKLKNNGEDILTVLDMNHVLTSLKIGRTFFYLIMHSTHCIHSYMALDIW